MFQEAESLLCCEEWPAAQQLLGLAAQQLPCICDVKALEDCCYYRLNNTKVGRGRLSTISVIVQHYCHGCSCRQLPIVLQLHVGFMCPSTHHHTQRCAWVAGTHPAAALSCRCLRTCGCV